MVWKRRPFKAVLSLGNRKKSAGLSPENRVDGAQRMSDVLPDNCRWGAMRELAQCRGATSKSGFPIIQVSSYAQHPSNALKFPGTTVCLPSDHVVQIHDGQCLSNQKTQPTTPWSLTDSSVLFFIEETLSPVLQSLCLTNHKNVWLSNWNVSVKFLPNLQQNFTHIRCSSSSFIVTLSLIWRTACACAEFSGCSSTTNTHSETGGIASNPSMTGEEWVRKVMDWRDLGLIWEI